MFDYVPPSAEQKRNIDEAVDFFFGGPPSRAEERTKQVSGLENIVTPCCGTPLEITTTTVGYGHMATEVPDEIYCTGEKCYNFWNRYGEADKYNVNGGNK